MAESKTYHIYGRKAYTEPLAFVERLQIDDVSALDAETLKGVGKRDWVELIAFPESSIVHVIPRDDDQ